MSKKARAGAPEVNKRQREMRAEAEKAHCGGRNHWQSEH